MTLTELVNKVVVKMDELTPFEEGLILSSGNDGVMPIRAYVESLLPESCREHLLICPIHKIPTVCLGTFSAFSGNPVLTITKPTDYIKLDSLQFTPWKRSVTETIKPSDPKVKLQSNVNTRGSISKPIVVEYSNKLECYTSTVTTTVANTYVKYIAPETITDDYTINQIAWLCASKVLGIMKEKSAETAKQNYIQGLQN